MNFERDIVSVLGQAIARFLQFPFLELFSGEWSFESLDSCRVSGEGANDVLVKYLSDEHFMNSLAAAALQRAHIRMTTRTMRWVFMLSSPTGLPAGMIATAMPTKEKSHITTIQRVRLGPANTDKLSMYRDVRSRTSLCIHLRRRAPKPAVDPRSEGLHSQLSEGSVSRRDLPTPARGSSRSQVAFQDQPTASRSQPIARRPSSPHGTRCRPTALR